MLAVRVCARLDVKPTLGVVKGVRFEGLRVVGPVHELAARYEAHGADEILYLDITASLYGRPMSLDTVRRLATELTIPLTVGGGVRTLDDVRAVMRAGADKVAINTGAFADPGLIRAAARMVGSQAIVASIESKRCDRDHEPYTLGGRERTGWKLADWIARVVEDGAGEVLLTSIDRDGTRQGYDFLLPRGLPVPVVVSGGAGHPAHCVAALMVGADAVAVGTILHDGTTTIGAIKQHLQEDGINVRLA